MRRGDMKLQEKMDEFKKNFEKQAPKAALEIMHGATEALRTSGIVDRTVKIGDKAPDFSLKNTKGEEVTLKGLLTGGPVVLGFYRGKW